MVLAPEDTDGFGGLYGEVVTEDIYKLRSLDFVPDAIIDIGANIGIFSRFARELFPQALIVAVEPHPANFEILQAHAPADPCILLNKALGRGQVYHGLTAANGSGATYLSAQPGYPAADLAMPDPSRVAVATKTIMLDELANAYVEIGQKLLLKIDCEGAENIIFTHGPSMDVLRSAELHCRGDSSLCFARCCTSGHVGDRG